MVSNDMEVSHRTEFGHGAQCLKVSRSMAAEPTNQCWQLETEDQTQKLGMEGGERQTGDIYACLHCSLCLRHRCRFIDTDTKMGILPLNVSWENGFRNQKLQTENRFPN